MLDRDYSFDRKIYDCYPYPIAEAYRNLVTQHYRESGLIRLKQIDKTVENIVSFLTSLVLVDLERILNNSKYEVPELFKNDLRKCMKQSSMSKWMAVLRGAVKIIIENNHVLYVSEIPDLIFKKNNKNTSEHEAFNRLIEIRNIVIGHDKQNFTFMQVETFCKEADELLKNILKGMEFITQYSLYYIGKTIVKNMKASRDYRPLISDLAGSGQKFPSDTSVRTDLDFNTPAVIIKKRERKENLCLEPLIIYAAGGREGREDIFFYDEQNNGKYIYRPVSTGEKFSLTGSEYETELTGSIDKLISLLCGNI